MTTNQNKDLIMDIDSSFKSMYLDFCILLKNVNNENDAIAIFEDFVSSNTYFIKSIQANLYGANNIRDELKDIFIDIKKNNKLKDYINKYYFELISFNSMEQLREFIDSMRDIIDMDEHTKEVINDNNRFIYNTSGINNGCFENMISLNTCGERVMARSTGSKFSDGAITVDFPFNPF